MRVPIQDGIFGPLLVGDDKRYGNTCTVGLFNHRRVGAVADQVAFRHEMSPPLHSPRAPAGLVVSSLVTIGRFPTGRASKPAMNRLESSDARVNRKRRSDAPSGVGPGGLHPQPVDRATGGEVRGTVVDVPQEQVAGISGNRIIPTGEPPVSKTQTPPAPVQYTRPSVSTFIPSGTPPSAPLDPAP